jgi:competence protein ComEA
MRPPSRRAAPDALDRLTALLASAPAVGGPPADDGATGPDASVGSTAAAVEDRKAQRRLGAGRMSLPLVIDVSLLRVLAGLAVLALVAGGVATFLFLRGRPAPVISSAMRPTGHAGATFSSSGGGAVATASPTVLVVSVQGRVRRPGIVRLPPGSRVVDAIAAAGGAPPATDLATVNLAAKVTDGEQIVVGVGSGTAGAGLTAGGSRAAGAPPGPVGLNTATAAQLDALPGVGPVMAQRIVDYRTAHGGFQRIDQLQDVPGIGPSKFAQLRDLVTL